MGVRGPHLTHARRTTDVAFRSTILRSRYIDCGWPSEDARPPMNGADFMGARKTPEAKSDASREARKAMARARSGGRTSGWVWIAAAAAVAALLVAVGGVAGRQGGPPGPGSSGNGGNSPPATAWG